MYRDGCADAEHGLVKQTSIRLSELFFQDLTMSSTAPVSSTKETSTTEETQPSNEYEDAEKNYQLKSLKFWTIVVSVLLSIFLVALVSPRPLHVPYSTLSQTYIKNQDRTIIATAIPRITDEFNSIQDIGWYGSAYMLTCACFNLISGRIYQLYSTKKVFLLSIVVFEIGSALCGGAPNSPAFIVGRAIAGIGGAFIFSGGNVSELRCLCLFLTCRVMPGLIPLF